jgi:tRNA G10  N-methylase Trm11
VSGGRGFNFVFAVEDQRDWQRIKGCFRNSFSCFFCHLLRILNVRRVLDVNYGIGSFYEKCFQDLEITGVDVKKWGWIVEPDYFILSDMNAALGSVRGKFDAIVMDPPYNTRPSSRIGSRRNYLYHGHVEFNALLNAIEMARRRGLADYIILKYMPIANEEVELLKIAKYRVMWRFVRHAIAAHNGNKVVRNYTEVFIIEGNI